MQIKGASYARYSTELQNDRSIEDQHRDNGLLADGEDAEISPEHEYSDRALSGASVFGRWGLSQLMSDARDGKFERLFVESLDRISRNQAELAAIFADLQFLGIDIISRADGKVDEFHVGFRGILGSVYLKDLAIKIRRGLAGVNKDGRYAGGKVYGYRPVPGCPGVLEIEESEAEVVRRIFSEYAGGRSSRQIVAKLNAEKVPPPRGKHWTASTLSGNKARGYGILVNPLYDGTQVWNRVRMVRNPSTGKRVSRVNPENEWKKTPAPQLAIVPHDLFKQVQRRIGKRTDGEGDKPWQHRRPKRLLSGLLKCGCCGGGMSIKDHSRYGTRIQCSAAKEGGACGNTRAYPLEAIEQQVIKGLGERLGSTTAIAAFVRAYNDERRALNADGIKRRSAIERRLEKIAAERESAVDLLVRKVIKEADGAKELQKLEKEATDLQSELEATAKPPNVVELHPAAVSRYLETIDRLAEALAGDESSDALMPVRELIDRVVVTPEDNGVTIFVEGKLNRLIGGNQYPTMVLGGLMVAEEGLEPPTRGL